VPYVFVGALKLDLLILESHSLKEKRMVLRRIKDRARERLGLIVVEVGAHELWQRAELGLATASGDRGKLMELLDDAQRWFASTEGVELLAQRREVTRFEGEPLQVEPSSTGAAGEAARRDAEWTPPEWQRMLDEESR
jgi:uncharacterized protein